ncbi:MAG: hypothetical protein R3320_13730, partial [Nitriliruptorales bacterium]|nr:hypothetical protein [Nitriliruptorales bacterium]
MTDRSPDQTSGDTTSDASSRPPRDEWCAGVGPDPTAPPGVGADHPPSAPRWLLEDDSTASPTTTRRRHT